MPSPTLNTKCVFYEHDKVNHAAYISIAIAIYLPMWYIRVCSGFSLPEIAQIRNASGNSLFTKLSYAT